MLLMDEDDKFVHLNALQEIVLRNDYDYQFQHIIYGVSWSNFSYYHVVTNKNSNKAQK
jgi:cytidylate kinase